jgi:hypothetical protein
VKEQAVHLLKSLGLAAAIGLCAAPAAILAQPAAPAQPPGGPGSLHGVWNNVNFRDVREGPPPDAPPTFNDATGQPIPMFPWVRKVVEERNAGWAEGKAYEDYDTNCMPAGMPGAYSTNAQAPIQFVESPDQKQITVLHEQQFSTFRVIKMDQDHPSAPTPSRMGDSVGHWEGDTLVVDTIAVRDDTMIRGTIPHSDKLHLVERIRRTGPQTLESRLTIEDPMIFSRPWTLVARFKKVPGMRMAEFICTNNRHFTNSLNK